MVYHLSRSTKFYFNLNAELFISWIYKLDKPRPLNDFINELALRESYWMLEIYEYLTVAFQHITTRFLMLLQKIMELLLLITYKNLEICVITSSHKLSDVLSSQTFSMSVGWIPLPQQSINGAYRSSMNLWPTCLYTVLLSMQKNFRSNKKACKCSINQSCSDAKVTQIKRVLIESYRNQSCGVTRIFVSALAVHNDVVRM